MTYHRVIPRDLFNEAKLLKCLGALWIENERLGILKFSETGARFEIEQDNSDGSLYLSNYSAWLNGEPLHLSTPLNCKLAYPLLLTRKDKAIFVFDDNGKLSTEFIEEISQ